MAGSITITIEKLSFVNRLTLGKPPCRSTRSVRDGTDFFSTLRCLPWIHYPEHEARRDTDFGMPYIWFHPYRKRPFEAKVI